MGRSFYNYDRVCSYDATYHFIVGGRGIGKTYGAQKRAVSAAIKKGEQFIYVRRYKPELQTARNTFFAAIEHEFPNHDFRTNGWAAQYAPVATRDEKKRQWYTIGFFVALSVVQSLKSVAFPKVKTIIFDEFIIERGSLHYLPDEATIFNNFYNTVDRYRDEVKVFFLANSVSIMNPYFIEYEIRPDDGHDMVRSHDGFIVAHFPESSEFNASIYETRFGKFIKDTEYADYAVGNAFGDNHEALIMIKNHQARYLYTLECRTGTFSVWHTSSTDEYFIQEKRPKSELIFTLLPEKMSEDKTLWTVSDKPLAYLRTAFRSARVYFDKPSTRNTLTEIFKR
jgi:hypothetical protein